MISISGALPNLLIIGAPKCGTTSLHNYLNDHPEISMSEIKELDFFITAGAWENGVAWYERQFDPDAKVRGESSTSYTRDENGQEVAARVGEILSDFRIIYMVRDPIDRIYSDYSHHRAKGREQLPLGEALRVAGNGYVKASSYASQLAPYVARFGAERILVETQERLLNQRPEALSRIFRFLDVDDNVYLPEFDLRWERSEGKGWLYSLAWKLRRRGVRLPKSLKWPAQRLLRSRFAGGGAVGLSEMDPVLRTELVERFRPEVAQLRDLTGMRFEEWSL